MQADEKLIEVVAEAAATKLTPQEERGMVLVAGRCASKAGEVPRALQPRAAAQRAGRSDARRIRRVAPVEGEIFYVDGARPPESLDRASGVRENRVNSGRKDVPCPKSLTRFVTENGSGPQCNLSYSYVNESWGQVTPQCSVEMCTALLWGPIRKDRAFFPMSVKRPDDHFLIPTPQVDGRVKLVRNIWKRPSVRTLISPSPRRAQPPVSLRAVHKQKQTGRAAVQMEVENSN